MSDGAMGTPDEKHCEPAGRYSYATRYRPRRTPPMNAALTGSDRIWQRIPMARPHMGYRNSAPSALGRVDQPSLRLDFLACDTEEVGVASFCGFQKGALTMHVVDPTCHRSMMRDSAQEQHQKPE